MMKRLGIGMVVLLCACGGGAKSLLDPAFGTMGSTVTTFSCPGNGISKSLVKTANGFVASGLGCEGWALVGYTAKGEVDPAFGDAGVALFFSGDGVFSATDTLAVRSDGRLLVSGSKGSKSLLRQLSATGKIDDAFTAASEKEITDYFPASFEMALQPDGNLILAQGETMIRIKPDGTRDLTFGSLGSQRLTLFGRDGFIQYVLIQETGHIVLVGSVSSTDNYFVAQFTSAGVLDSSFGTNGIFRLMAPPSGGNRVSAVTAQSDGKLILAGADYDSTGIVHPVLWRITAAGSLDSTFGTNGRATGLVDKGHGAFNAVSVLAGGAIATAGPTQKADDVLDSWQVARFTPAGKLDPSFAVEGTTVFDVGLPALVGGASAMVTASDGWVIAGRVRKTEGGPVLFGLARVLP